MHTCLDIIQNMLDLSKTYTPALDYIVGAVRRKM